MNTLDESQNSTPFSPAKMKLGGLILAVGVAGLFLNFLIRAELKQTALLYIGLPTIIAAIVSMTYQPKSARGITMMAITIGVLLSGILFSEGIVCMIMALPLFYLIGLLGVYLFRVIRSFRSGGGTTSENDASSTLHIQILLALPLLLMSVEGTHPFLSFDRSQEVRVERQIVASSAEIEAALARPIEFDHPLPLFLRLGFPTPARTAALGTGLDLGATRVIPFTMQGNEGGAFHLRVAERDESSVTFTVEQNSTAIAGWLALHEAEVEWQSNEVGSSVVAWTFRYDRLLDPAWYFGPLERYAVALSADYLIETVATPSD